MQAKRFWVLLFVFALLGRSGAFVGCADGDLLPSSASHPRGGAGAVMDGGAPAAGNAAGGVVSGNGGAGATSGSSIATEGGTNAGAGAGGVREGSVGGAADGGVGGAPAGEGEQLRLCARLSGQTILAGRMAHDFETNVYYDCRISWLVVKSHALDDFLVAMTSFNYAFWGCANQPITTFALVDGKPSLSVADVAALSDDYVAGMNTVLQNSAQNGLSPGEIVEMKAALGRLANPFVTNPSPELSKPACMGAGGAGGVAGAGGAP